MIELDALGIRYGTDKSCLGHDYLRHYDRILSPLRQSSITLLEIGVFDGASLRTWESYFPKATVVGLDINERCRKFAGGRRIVEIASQADPEALTRIAREYSPMVVIDDGSHRADHILISFNTLFPLLPPSGIYIIEDVAMHVGPNANNLRHGAESPQSHLLDLANKICFAHRGGFDSIEFFHSAVVIRKRAVEQELEILRAAVEASHSHWSWGRFAGYLLRLGKADEAVRYARRAIQMNGKIGLHYRQLAGALERLGKQKDAAAAIEDGLRQVPRDPKLKADAERMRG